LYAFDRVPRIRPVVKRLRLTKGQGATDNFVEGMLRKQV
jgi:hypothetical protein